MDPIPLNDVRAAAADVASDTVDTAVAAPVADIVGAAADARAALAGTAADTAVASVVIVASTSPAPSALAAASGLKPAARAWLPSLPPKLLLSSSMRTRLLSRSLKPKYVFKEKFHFSGAYAGGDHSRLDG